MINYHKISLINIGEICYYIEKDLCFTNHECSKRDKTLVAGTGDRGTWYFLNYSFYFY